MRITKFYEDQYDERFWQGFVGKLVGTAHKIMEFRYSRDRAFGRVLEVGAGNGT